MRLVNDTPYESRLLRSETPSGRMMAALVVRATYRIDAHGALARIAADEAPAWAGIRDDGVEHEAGALLPEPTLPRSGADVMLVGGVPGEGRRRAELRARVGPYHLALTITGARRWERGVRGGLQPSRPEPFARVALRPQEAFGGAAAGTYGPTPYPRNPAGRGYYLAASEARDAPLPSVEWAGEEVQAWDDRPEPAVVGPYPQAWWSRLERVWVADAAQETIRLDPAGGPFDLAHPRLSGRPIPDRAPLTIDGAGPPVRARLPACPARVTWILGDAACPRALAIDEVIVDLDARVVALAWRKIVQYEYVRHQERRAIVEENAEETAA